LAEVFQLGLLPHIEDKQCLSKVEMPQQCSLTADISATEKQFNGQQTTQQNESSNN